jgi:hypothetical protein
MATVQQHSLLVSKDPPSYYSIYMGEHSPTPPALPAVERTTLNYRYSIKQYVKRRCALLQRLLAATFVATTISTTIMLLLWQLQNLTDPQGSDDGPWFEPQK